MLFVIGGLFLVLNWPLFQGKIFASLDHNAFTIPMRVCWATALQSGEWGHWSPFIWRGFSLLGKGEAGTLHPIQLFAFKFLPITLSIRLWLGAALPIVCIGSYVLLRYVYRFLPGPSLFGAASYSVSTFYTAHFGMTHMTIILAHTPWALIALERCLIPPAVDNPSKSFAQRCAWAALLGVVYGSAFLLGHPQMVWFISVTVGAAFLYRGIEHQFDRPWRIGLVLVCVAITAGLLVGMAQLLPTLNEIAKSGRITMDQTARGNFSLHPIHLLQNLSPYFFEETVIGDLFLITKGPSYFQNNPSSYSVYFGLPLYLSYACMVVYWNKFFSAECRARTITVLLIALILVSLMMGRYGGVNDVLGTIPLVRAFSSPNRYKAVLAFIISGFAVIALQLAETETHRKLRWVHIFLLAFPLILVLSVFVYGCGTDAVVFRGREFKISGLPRLLYPLFLSFAGLALFLMAVHGKIWASRLLGVLCVLDLAAFGFPIALDVPYKTIEDLRHLKSFVAEPQNYRVYTKAEHDFWWYGEPWWMGRHQTTGFSGSLIPREQLRYDTKEHHLRLASVGHIVDVRQKSVQPVDKPIPRVRLASELRHSSTPLQDLSNVDLETTIFCRPDSAPALTGAPIKHTEFATLVKDTFDRLHIKLKVEYQRILVISDRWDDGWKAYVDNCERPVFPVYNRMMRALFVYPEDRDLVLVYKPPALQKGIQFSIVGAGVILALLLPCVLHVCHTIKRSFRSRKQPNKRLQ